MIFLANKEFATLPAVARKDKKGFWDSLNGSPLQSAKQVSLLQRALLPLRLCERIF